MSLRRERAGCRNAGSPFVYVGRNAILPLFTQLTISIGFIVGGSFLVEPIFQYQGIGYTLFKAMQSRDYPLLQGIFLMITISVVVANLVADLLYSRLDPRIRRQGGATEWRSKRRLSSLTDSPRAALHRRGESPDHSSAGRPAPRRLVAGFLALSAAG